MVFLSKGGTVVSKGELVTWRFLDVEVLEVSGPILVLLLDDIDANVDIFLHLDLQGIFDLSMIKL